jgi:protein gp37
VADGVRWPVVGILAEPLRGALDLRQVNSLCLAGFGSIDWIVCGRAEESDGTQRPTWAMDLRDQAEDRGIPFLFTGWHEGERLLDGRIWDETPSFRGERNHLHIFDHCRTNCRRDSRRITRAA